MSTWWRVHRYRAEIEPVEMLSETPKYVVVRSIFYNSPVRHLKGTEYFPTFAEARTHLLETSSRKFKDLTEEAERERQRYDKIFMMEPPKGTNETT